MELLKRPLQILALFFLLWWRSLKGTGELAHGIFVVQSESVSVARCVCVCVCVWICLVLIAESKFRFKDCSQVVQSSPWQHQSNYKKCIKNQPQIHRHFNKPHIYRWGNWGTTDRWLILQLCSARDISPRHLIYTKPSLCIVVLTF